MKINLRNCLTMVVLGLAALLAVPASAQEGYQGRTQSRWGWQDRDRDHDGDHDRDWRRDRDRDWDHDRDWRRHRDRDRDHDRDWNRDRDRGTWNRGNGTWNRGTNGNYGYYGNYGNNGAVYRRGYSNGQDDRRHHRREYPSSTYQGADRRDYNRGYYDGYNSL